MDDLVAFLKARLDEDEAVAQETVADFGDHWTVDGERVRGSVEYVDVLDGPGMPYAHIARHDPARVLREVEAKRRLLALHAPTGPGGDDCVVCDYGADSCGCMGTNGGWPCATLELLALPYSGHPDYRPAWSPTA